MSRIAYDENCIFCKIAHEEIVSKKLYSDEKIFAFYDISPVAPIHALIIPKIHIQTLDDVSTDDNELLGHLIVVATSLARRLGVAEQGYRLNFNCKQDGGQTVFHVHAHLLGGQKMGWPPFPTS